MATVLPTKLLMCVFHSANHLKNLFFLSSIRPNGK